MATYKPTGMAQKHPQIVELGAGLRPLRLHNFPAPYLPILETVNKGMTTIQDYVVIKAGMVVGVDPWGYLVPATGYYAASNGVTMTYTDIDVTMGVIDLDTMATTTKKDYFALTDLYYGTAVSAAGASTNKIVAWPIGIAEHDIYLNHFVMMDAYHNYKTHEAVTVLTANTIQVPLIKSANLVIGDYVVPDNPTSDTFSAANVNNMGRPISLSTYVASLTISDAATMKSVYGRLQGMIFGRTLDVVKIDDITKFNDYVSNAPGFGFGSPTTAGSAITDYTNIPPHLADAQELDRSINGTDVTGRYHALIQLGPSVGRN